MTDIDYRLEFGMHLWCLLKTSSAISMVFLLKIKKLLWCQVLVLRPVFPLSGSNWLWSRHVFHPCVLVCIVFEMFVYIILYSYTHISLIVVKCCKSVFLSLQGRNPFFLEPSVIITITDGNKLTHSSGVPDEVMTHCLYSLDSVSKLRLYDYGGFCSSMSSRNV